VGRCGLSVGAGDANQPQPLIGITVKHQRGSRERTPAVPHLYPDALIVLRGISFTHHRNRTRGTGCWHKTMTVDVSTRKRKEDASVPNLA
jgi:hypothetical protein